MSYKTLINKTDVNINPELVEKFINTAMTSTLQEEFYTKKDEQTKSVKKTHTDMIENNRDFYATSLLLPINDIHKILVIQNLLSKKEGRTDEENNIILDTLKQMQINRAYKTLYILCLNKVNNARAKWLSRQFIRERGTNIVFDIVKYKRLIRVIGKHFHIDFTKITKNSDIERFLFNKDEDKIKEELLKDYIKAKTDVNSIYKLPFSIALGFKNLHKIDDKEFFEKIQGKMSRGEKRRMQATATKAGVKIDVDIKSFDPVTIQKFIRSEGAKGKDDLIDRFEQSCKREAEKLQEYFNFKKIKVLVDNSGSMYGSEEKKYHPIAVGEAVANVLKYLSEETEVVGTPSTFKFNMTPEGETDLTQGILKIMEDINFDEETLFVLITDGYENAPAGLANMILYVLKKKLDKKDKLTLLHLNPVYAPESGDVKKLGDVAQTYGIRDTRQLFIILMLSIIRAKKEKEIKKILTNMKKKVEIREKKKRQKK